MFFNCRFRTKIVCRYVSVFCFRFLFFYVFSSFAHISEGTGSFICRNGAEKYECARSFALQFACSLQRGNYSRFVNVLTSFASVPAKMWKLSRVPLQRSELLLRPFTRKGLSLKSNRIRVYSHDVTHNGRSFWRNFPKTNKIRRHASVSCLCLLCYTWLNFRFDVLLLQGKCPPYLKARLKGVSLSV